MRIAPQKKIVINFFKKWQTYFFKYDYEMDIFLNNSLLFFVALAIGFAWLGQHFIKIPAFISFLLFAILY